MFHTFWSLLLAGLWRTLGFSALAFILGIVLWLVPSDTTATLSIKWVLTSWIFWLVLVAAIGNALFEAIKANKPALPRIILSREPPTQMQDARVLCLLEPSDLFSFGIGVSFYYTDNDGFEQLIGIGRVSNIQEDKKIQVLMLHVSEGQDETARKLAVGDAGVLKRTRIKPSAPVSFVDLVAAGGE